MNHLIPFGSVVYFVLFLFVEWLLLLQLFLVAIVGKESVKSEETSAVDDDVSKTDSEGNDSQATRPVYNATRKPDIDLTNNDASDDELTEEIKTSKRQKVRGGTSSNHTSVAAVLRTLPVYRNTMVNILVTLEIPPLPPSPRDKT